MDYDDLQQRIDDEREAAAQARDADRVVERLEQEAREEGLT